LYHSNGHLGFWQSRLLRGEVELGMWRNHTEESQDGQEMHFFVIDRCSKLSYLDEIRNKC